MSEIKWEHNASTGQQIANVTKNGRIMRQGFNDGTFLYWAEFWGDYSLRYPTSAPYRKTFAQARKDLDKLARAEGVAS